MTDYNEIKSTKLNIADFIEKNTVDEAELIKEATKRIVALEKQKKEIDLEIKAEKQKLIDNGINVSEFNRVLTTIKTELKMSYEALKENVKIYNSIVEDPTFLNTLRDDIM